MFHWYLHKHPHTQKNPQKPDNEPERLESPCCYNLNSNIYWQKNRININSSRIHSKIAYRTFIHAITQFFISAIHYRCYRRKDSPPGVRGTVGNMSARCCQSSDRCDLPVTADRLLNYFVYYLYIYIPFTHVCFNPINLQQTLGIQIRLILYTACADPHMFPRSRSVCVGGGGGWECPGIILNEHLAVSVMSSWKSYWVDKYETLCDSTCINQCDWIWPD